ncbi:ORFY protein [Cacao swollen shoot Ghana N virus]|uniref:ORFY protein n=1 Tax=Cacao swollen shoot Ghana N virus TaxID=2056884 RepID=A0A2H4U958_9VIRU|nr:ORFY protein [Cacao swollen shoot Ghana N virus]ATZ69487.1 ORFY protein [Cacao swollen shoot Ghana N virus]
MEPAPEARRGRRSAGEIPATQLCGADYPYSLAYDGLLQIQHNAFAATGIRYDTYQTATAQLHRIEEEAAKRAVHALRDLQGILRFKRSHLESMATRDNYASDRLPAALEDSQKGRSCPQRPSRDTSLQKKSP